MEVRGFKHIVGSGVALRVVRMLLVALVLLAGNAQGAISIPAPVTDKIQHEELLLAKRQEDRPVGQYRTDPRHCDKTSHIIRRRSGVSGFLKEPDARADNFFSFSPMGPVAVQGTCRSFLRPHYYVFLFRYALF